MGKKRPFKILVSSLKLIFPFPFILVCLKKQNPFVMPQFIIKTNLTLIAFCYYKQRSYVLFLIELAALIFIDIPCGLNNIKKAKVKAQSFQRNKRKDLQDIW